MQNKPAALRSPGGLKCNIALWSERLRGRTARARMIDDNQEKPNEAPQTGADGEEQRRRSRRRGRRGKSRGGSAPGAEQQPETVAAPPSAPQPPPQRQHFEASRPPEQLRPGRNVFRDGIDRQVCIARESLYPVEWPVNYRVGLAVRKLTEVGRTAESLLLCDLSHPGPCVWPEHLGREPAQMVSAPAPVSNHNHVEEVVTEPVVETAADFVAPPEPDQSETEESAG